MKNLFCLTAKTILQQQKKKQIKEITEKIGIFHMNVGTINLCVECQSSKILHK